jgi:hypothetical protein
VEISRRCGRTALPSGGAGRPASHRVAGYLSGLRVTVADHALRLILEPHPRPGDPQAFFRDRARRRSLTAVRRDPSGRYCSTCSGWLAAHRSGSNDSNSVSPVFSDSLRRPPGQRTDVPGVARSRRHRYRTGGGAGSGWPGGRRRVGLRIAGKSCDPHRSWGRPPSRPFRAIEKSCQL